MARVNLHNSNALMSAYNQSRTIPPRITRSAEDDNPDTRLIPGFGPARDQSRRGQQSDRSVRPFGPPRAGRAPYQGKRGTPRIRKGNYPYRGRKPQVN